VLPRPRRQASIICASKLGNASTNRWFDASIYAKVFGISGVVQDAGDVLQRHELVMDWHE
jgi:hypothetical protein